MNVNTLFLGCNICLVSYFIACLVNAEVDNIVDINKLGPITTSSNITQLNVNTTQQSKIVPSEGGEVKVVQQSDTTHQGREGVVTEPGSSKNVTNSSSQVQSSVNPYSIPIGSPVNKTQDNAINITTTAQTPLGNFTGHLIPPYETADKNDGTSSVPKKEPKYIEHSTLKPLSLNVSDVPVHLKEKPVGETTKTAVSNSTSVNTTTQVKERPKKPLFTEASDDPPSPKKTEESNVHNNFPSIESVEEQSRKSADYVVPIVGVILSVPLVAIVISVLYKRGSEWWYHRHYRRIDFLIEGMYNN